MEDEIEELEEDELILFNDRKKPLKVLKITETDDGVEAEVEGPGGAVYVLYRNEGSELVASKGNRKYSSYLKELRKIGAWETQGRGKWKHSKTKAEIRVEDNDGLWQVETEGFEPSMQSPLYGFTSEQVATEHVQKIIEKHPEGKTHEKI